MRLRKNVELRPNATSYAARAHAELAASDHGAAKMGIDRALATPVVSASLLPSSRLRVSTPVTQNDFPEMSRRVRPK